MLHPRNWSHCIQQNLSQSIKLNLSHLFHQIVSLLQQFVWFITSNKWYHFIQQIVPLHPTNLSYRIQEIFSLHPTKFVSKSQTKFISLHLINCLITCKKFVSLHTTIFVSKPQTKLISLHLINCLITSKKFVSLHPTNFLITFNELSQCIQHIVSFHLKTVSFIEQIVSLHPTNCLIASNKLPHYFIITKLINILQTAFGIMKIGDCTDGVGA